MVSATDLMTSGPDDGGSEGERSARRRRRPSPALALPETVHDLRAPLAAAAAHAEILMEMAGPRLEHQEQARMAMLLHSIDRMSTIIDEVLTSDTGQLPGDPSTDVDLDGLLADVIPTLGDAARGAELQVAPLGRVPGNPVQLSRLFQNLVGNALMHRHPVRRAVVRVSARDDGEERVFTICDNGVGMARNQWTRIFDPRCRCAPDEAGHGMGLRICRRIVEDHGGRIWMDSVRDGTAISVALPQRARST